jgi:hypothetical protein
MCECKLCGKEQKSLMNLSKHLSNNHKYSPKDYYDLYLKKSDEHNCLICGNETKYYMFTEGYRATCSCKCAAILYRKELKDDSVKFQAFQKKVAINQERIWADREITGEDKIIHTKVGNTISANNLLLTTDQLKDRFGWLNKLSIIEKDKWKNEVMFNTGCHSWWKTASEQEKIAVQRKRNAAKLKVTEEIIDNLALVLTDKELYYISVNYITAITYTRHKHIIDKDAKRGNDYHLDHKFSVIKGFIEGISPEIIGSIYNLEIIPRIDNVRKNSGCSITKEELLEKYYGP